jgi:hypothetical protein
MWSVSILEEKPNIATWEEFMCPWQYLTKLGIRIRLSFPDSFKLSFLFLSSKILTLLMQCNFLSIFLCNTLRIDHIHVLIPLTRCPSCHHFYSQLGNTCSVLHTSGILSPEKRHHPTATMFPLRSKNPVLKWWLVFSFPWKMYKGLLTKSSLSHLSFTH